MMTCIYLILTRLTYAVWLQQLLQRHSEYLRYVKIDDGSILIDWCFDNDACIYHGRSFREQLYVYICACWRYGWSVGLLQHTNITIKMDKALMSLPMLSWKLRQQGRSLRNWVNCPLPEQDWRTLFLAINWLVHPSSSSIVLINHPLHHLYSRMIPQNILCISCVHFVHQPLLDPLNIPIQPNHTRYVVESIDMYP